MFRAISILLATLIVFGMSLLIIPAVGIISGITNKHVIQPIHAWATDPEPPTPDPQPEPDPVMDLLQIDLRDVAVNNRWQADPDDFWKLAETEQGWVIEIDRDGDAGRRNAHDWEVVAENINPVSVDYDDGVITYNTQDPQA